MPEQPETARSNKLIILIVTSFGALLPPFMSSAINLALPALENAFNLNSVFVNWLATSYLLATAIFLVPFGRAADILGRKKFYVAGFMLYTLASALCGLAPSIYLLLCYRVLQGIGSAMIFATSLSLVTSAFPPNERGQALGFNVAATYLGLSLGPFIGGFLTQHFGWPMVFLINVPPGILIILLTLWQVKGEWAESKGERWDIKGSLLYGLGLLGLMYGFSTLTSLWGIFILIGGLGALCFFGWYESRIAHPVLNLTLLKSNKVFLFSSLAALINYSATFATGFLLSRYLQNVKGLLPQAAGLVLLVQPVCQAVLSPLAGFFSDRLEPRRVASLGMILTVVGLIFLTQLSAETSEGYIMIALAFLGTGFAFFSAPNSNAIMSAVEKRFYGVASGMVGTMRMMGQNISMGIVMLVTVIFMGREKLAPRIFPEFVASLRMSFLILSLLSFIGIFFSLARGKLRMHTKE